MRNLYKIIFLFVLVNVSCVLSAKNHNGVNNLTLPIATITGTASVCQNALQPQITLTGSGGTAPYTFIYKIGTGSNVSIVSSGTGAVATINAPTTTTGIFVYTLVSVTDSSGTQPQSGSATVTVNALPTITGTLNACVGSTSDLNSSSNGGTWTSSNQSVATVDASGKVSGVAVGNTDITYTDGSGCKKVVVFKVNALPIVDFTTPNNINATPNCSDTAIQFSAAQMQSGIIYSYAWDFGDGTLISTTSTSTTTHTFEVFGIGNQSFNVGLTVTNTVTGCVSTTIKAVIVKKSPDSRLDTNSTDGATAFVTSKNLFINCTATIASPNFIFKAVNASTTIPTNTSYSIDWGDLSPLENFVAFTSATHNYTALGFFNIIITTTNSSTICSKTKIYRFFNGNSPIGNLDSPGNANSCVPYSYTWNVDPGTFKNPPGTSYVFSVNDGSTNQTFTQETLPATITHQFNKSSCGLGLAGNKFTVTFEITNPCDSNAPTTLVSSTQKPIADFTISPTTAANTYCVNKTILLTNISQGFYGTSCETNYNKTWIITPSTGWTINSGTLTSENIGITFNTAGNYSIKLAILQPGGSVTNTCTNDEITKNICIEPQLTPQFTLNNSSGCTPQSIIATNTTVTTNSCSPPTYAWSVTYVPAYCGASIAAIPNQTTTNATFNFTEPGTYTIKLAASNSCTPAQTTTQTVTVKKPPTVSITSINNYCGSATINPIATVPACVQPTNTLTYAWLFPGGTPSSATTANPGTINYPASTNPYTVSLVVTNECGASNTATQQFSVNTAPTISNTSLSQTICSGSTTTLVNITSSPSGATFSWTAMATAGISGFTSSGITNTTPIQTITNTGNTPGSVTYLITPTIGTCQGTPVNYVVTINPAPTNTTPLVSSTVCIGGTPNTLSVLLNNTSGNPSYQWYYNSGNLLSGQTSSTFSPPSSTVGSTDYYCVILLPTGGCSSIKTNTATVVVTPLLTVSTQPIATQNICIGGTIPAPLSVMATGGTGTVTYQWYSNTTNSTTGATPVGTNSATYTPPIFNAVGTFYYYAVVSANGSGCGTATSTFSEVAVVADPVISVQPLVTQTQCEKATTATALTITATGGIGAYSYQWYNTLNTTNTGGNPIGTNSPSYLPPTNTVGTFYYYCLVSQTGLDCSVKSNTATVVVVTAPQITTNPQSAAVCGGATLAPLTVTFSNGTGTATYQWYDDIGPKSGATSDTYSPTNTVTTSYYCIITFSSGGCTSITSSVATITINPQPTISTQPLATQNICVGGTISSPLSVTPSGGTGTPSYQWFTNTTNTTTGGTPVGTNSGTYTPPVLTIAKTYNYYVVITYSGGGCNSITSNLAQIVVVNDPTATQPLPMQTVCQNSPATVLSVVALGGIGTSYTFQWYSSIPNSNTGGNLISSETNNTFTPPTNSVGTLYYYCVIEQATGTGCNVSSATAKVTVSLAPAFTTALTPSAICLGQIPSQLIVATNSDSLSPNYQWYSNANSLNSGGKLLLNETNATFNPPNSIAGTTYYYCIVTFPSITGGCSEIISSPVEIIINPNPVISNKSTVICSGNAFAITPDTLGGDIVPMGTTYTWNNPIISPAGSITGALAQSTPQTDISQTLINNTINPAMVTYTVTPLSGVCIGVNFTVVVTVNPAISPNITLINSTCFGANNGGIQTNITGGIPFSSGAPYHISWISSNGFTSSATSISNLAPGNYTLSIIDAGGCPVDKSYTITEPVDIVITTDLEKDITCFNDANGEIKITITGGTLNYSYAWTKNGIPYATTEDLSNLSPGTYVVSVSDTNNCGPKTAAFTIIEPPILAVNFVNQTNILCFGYATGSINVNVTGGTLPHTFVWTGPNGFMSSTQNLTTILAGTYNLKVTDNSGCFINLSPVTITQTPEIIITATTTPIICYGGNDASISIDISGGVPSYQITWSNLGSGTFQNNLSSGDYLITVTDALNCVKTLNVNIPEAPIFTINPVVKNITCFGDHNGSINLNIIGGIAPVKLAWDDSTVAGNVRNNLGPGSYTVTIIDSKPCTIKRTFIILEPQLLVLSANLTNAFDCNNANSGAINLLVAGGSAPFTYAWSNGVTTADLVNIPAGNYLVTVTDANGCSKQAQYSINRPPPIVPSVVTKTEFDCETKYIKQTFVAQVSGGVPPYNLVWSSGTVSGSKNEFMNTSQNGTVILYVTDAIGCKSNYTFTVAIPTLGTPSFNASSYAYSTYGTYSINDPIQFTNTATGDYISMIWDFGDGSVSTDVNPVHTFINPKDYVVTQTVTYPFGCVYVQKTTFIVEKGYLLVVPNAFTPNNDTLNDSFRPVTRALKNVRLDIYDTWGSIIYSESGEFLRGWDGKIKGANAENGNYYYKVSGETFYGTIVNENHPFVLIK